jgi:hypothetical protein
MRVIRFGAAAAAAAMLLAQPCAAADDFRDSGATDRHMTAFAGLSVRMPLGSEGRPSARLRFATGYSLREAGSGAVRSSLGQGLEIGVGKKGIPTYFIGGQRAAELQQTLGIKGGTGTTLLIIGGVLVAVVIVAAAAGGGGFGDTCPTVGGDRSHCINP